MSDDPFSDPEAEVPDFPEHGNDATDDEGNLVGGPAVERTATAEDFPPADFDPDADDDYVSPIDMTPPDDLPEAPEHYVSPTEVPDLSPFQAEGNEGHIDVGGEG